MLSNFENKKEVTERTVGWSEVSLAPYRTRFNHWALKAGCLLYEVTMEEVVFRKLPISAPLSNIIQPVPRIIRLSPGDEP